MRRFRKRADATRENERIMVRLRRANGFAAAFAEIAAGLLRAAVEFVIGYEESKRLVSDTRVGRFGLKIFDPRPAGARSRATCEQEENGQQ